MSKYHCGTDGVEFPMNMGLRDAVEILNKAQRTADHIHYMTGLELPRYVYYYRVYSAA